MGRISLEKLQEQNQSAAAVKILQFDDLETFEHTRCKPLSVTLAVEERTRRVVGFEISSMAAKGRLAAIALKKYGLRKDTRAAGRMILFERIKKWIDPQAVIKSDDNPHYVSSVRHHFPTCRHFRFRGGRSGNFGQGELKKLKHDPIFSINHTFAKLRADINRLFRKTWCTTKKASQLKLHIAIMVVYHNHRLIDPKFKKPIFQI